jgi:hypothetical protein
MEVYNTIMSEFDEILAEKGLVRSLTKEQWEVLCDTDRMSAKVLKNILASAEKGAFKAWREELSADEKSKYSGKWLYVTGGKVSDPCESEAQATGLGMSSCEHIIPVIYVTRMP